MKEVFWVFFELSLNALQSIFTILFLNRMLPEKTQKRWPAFLFGSLFFLSLSSYIVFDLHIIDIWTFAAPLLYTLAFRNGSIPSKMLWLSMLIVNSYGALNSTFFIFELFGVSFNDVYAQDFTRICFTLTANLFMGSTLFLISYRKPVPFKRSTPAIFIIILNIISCIIEEYFWSLLVVIPQHEKQLFFFMVLCFLLAIVSVFLYKYMAVYALREAEMQRQVEAYRQKDQRMEELKGIYTSLRSLRHDLKNHIQISRMLYESGKTAEASEYMDQIDRDIFSVFSTGSLAVDSALTMEDLQMRRRNIRFVHSLCPLDELPISESELCSILSNLLDNALEGISRAENIIVDPIIILNIARVRDMLCIHCSNSYDPATVHTDKETFLTTKKQPGHGLGIRNIKSIVEKANGTSRFSAEDTHFVVEISLPYSN